MASQVPPKKNAAHTFYLSLGSQSSAYTFQTNPTLATGDVKVSTDGAAFANITTLPVVTPTGGKAVKVDLSASEMNGDNIQVLFSDAAGAEWADVLINIQTSARQIDDLAYPATSGRSLAVDTSGQVTVGTNNDKTGYALSSAGVQAIWDALASALTTVGSIGKRLVDNLDAAVSTRLASVGYTAPDNTSITAIKAKTDNLPSDPADASDIAASFGTVATTLGTISGYIDTEVAAIKAKTDNLPANPAAASDIPSAAANASAVRTELATELARIDAATTSRATPAQVNAEVVDALSVDTYAEPGAVPAATSSLKDKIGWLFALATNKRITTSTSDAVRNAGDTATIGTAALSDNGTALTRGKYS